MLVPMQAPDAAEVYHGARVALRQAQGVSHERGIETNPAQAGFLFCGGADARLCAAIRRRRGLVHPR